MCKVSLEEYRTPAKLCSCTLHYDQLLDNGEFLFKSKITLSNLKSQSYIIHLQRFNTQRVFLKVTLPKRVSCPKLLTIKDQEGKKCTEMLIWRYVTRWMKMLDIYTRTKDVSQALVRSPKQKYKHSLPFSQPRSSLWDSNFSSTLSAG